MQAQFGNSICTDAAAKSLNKESIAVATMAKEAGDLYVPENAGELILPTGRKFDPQAHGYKRVLPKKGSKNVGAWDPENRAGARMDKLHGSQFGRMVHNITHAVRTASAEDVRSGMDWYKRAHDFAGEIGRGNVERGAGAIAILSAQVGWNDNQRFARQLRDTGTASGGFVTRRQVSQAREVLEGAARPEQYLPMDRKTGNFYKNIVNPEDPESVTIDRHAHDITVGRVLGSADRGLQNPTRYNTFVEAHKTAAGNLNMLPSQAQAVGWVNWRRMRGIVD